ncbi:hypothetical protein [Virgibacillus senegalensis]|uniref:hypothetical protein n=1 Tax=Virgibacillus senegalensis TaxID=1499679 RepID=UPI00069DD85A|nr:hypothetical protein [Virgibacillus senegalensis]
MKNRIIFLIVMLAVTLFSLEACSKNSDSSSTADVPTEAESKPNSSGISADSDSKKQEEARDEQEPETEKSPHTDNAPKADRESESDAETPNEQTLAHTDESDSNREAFDVGEYLNENYPIENTHYTTETWENEETGETEYMVKILPDTKESDEEITGALKNGETDERIDKMMNLAEKIMDDLTEKTNNIHVDSVNYVSYDGDYGLTLIQDYR